MSKIEQIAEGYTNLTKKAVGTADNKVENMAADRYALCKACPFFTMANTCSKCGCFMPSKTRSKSAKCPQGKW